MCLAIIRKMMNWYETRTDYVSPVVRGMNRYKPADHKGRRILNDDEIRALWQVTEDMGTVGAFVRVLLLTAQRRNKVAQMRWDDIADGAWTIRAEEREKGTADKIKLPDAVLARLVAHCAAKGLAVPRPRSAPTHVDAPAQPGLPCGGEHGGDHQARVPAHAAA